MSADATHATVEPRDIADLERVVSAKDRRFTALVGAARLHPGRDLRGLDLGAIHIGPEEDVAGYDFSRCVMRGARLCGVDLRKAYFDDCDLTSADLRGACYSEAQLKTALCDDMLTGDWPERPKAKRKRVTLDPVAEAVKAALREAGDDNISALALAATDQLDEGNFAIAEALYAIKVDWYAEHYGPYDQLTWESRCFLAITMLEQGRAAEAEVALFTEQLSTEERVPSVGYPDLLLFHSVLAWSMLDQGRAAEAEAAFRALLSVQKRVLGVAHFSVLVTHYQLARALLDQGRTDEATIILELVADSPSAAMLLGDSGAEFAVQRARVADANADYEDGAAFLAEAEAHLGGFHIRDGYHWRMIDAYRAARVVAGAVVAPVEGLQA